MYNSDQTKALQQNTTEWLSGAKDNNISEAVKNKTEDLRNVCAFMNTGTMYKTIPLISDFEYDTLYKLLENFEKENPACHYC